MRSLFFDGGGLLATADGGAVRLWSLERRQRICSLKTAQKRDELHAGGVSCLHIDGSHLLSGGGDGVMLLYDLEDVGPPVCALRGHGAPVSEALLLAHEAGLRSRVISASTDGAVKLWDAAGAPIAELLPPAPLESPSPSPIALARKAAATPRAYCGHGAWLAAFDLHAEAEVGRVPLPARHDTGGPAVALHVATSVDSGSGSSGGMHMHSAAAGVGGSPHMLATCGLGTSLVHLWDARLMPSAATAEAEDGQASRRRCLVARVPLPRGTSCARQLHLDGARLLASLDYEHGATAFSRGAHALALYDIRRASSSLTPALGVEAAGAPAGAGHADAGLGERSEPSSLLWLQPVASEVSCFQCRGERVYVGTGNGTILVWDFTPGGLHTLGGLLADAKRHDADGERAERSKKRDKPRGNVKVRGRFPKTQGFSNQKGFR